MRECTVKELDKLIEFAGAAFGKTDKRWFAKCRPTIFQPTPRSAKCHRYVRDEKGIAGLIGIYPLHFRIGKAVLKVGGIGTVSVRPDKRGGGLMSAMLDDTIRTLEKDGYDMSWLGGNRFRYGNYGWEHGGRYVNYAIHMPTVLRRIPSLKPARIRVPAPKDIPALERVYRTIGAGMVRSPETWSIVLKHGELNWEMTTDKGRVAYCAFWKHKASEIVELAGAPDLACSLLLAHRNKWKTDWINILTPELSTPLNQRLYQICETFKISHNNQYRIVNAESLWKKLVPEIAAQAKARGIPSAAALLSSVVKPADRTAILHRALGFMESIPALPSRLHKFEWVRPVGWWFSQADSV